MKNLPWILCCLLLSILSAPLPAQPSVEKGKSLYQMKRYSEAALTFDAIKEGSSDYAVGRYYLGRIAYDRKEFDDAADYFEEATEVNPKSGEYFAWLGDSYAAIGADAGIFRQMSVGPKALKSWEKAVALDPGQLGARYSLIGSYVIAPAFMGGGQEKADALAKETLPLLEESIRNSPENFLRCYWYGKISAMTGLELNKGEEYIKKYLTYTPQEGEPSVAGAYMRLGQIKEKQGNKQDAKKYYEIALAKDGSLKGAKEGLERVSK